MTRVRDARRRLTAAEDLRSIVRTMKAMSAAAIRQFEDAEAALREYDRTVHRGLQAVLRVVPATEAGLVREAAASGRSDPPRILLAIGSDLGMCGSLNHQVVQRVRESMPEDPDAAASVRLLAVGSRLADLLPGAAGPLQARFTAPASAAAVTASAAMVLAAIDPLLAGHADASLHVVFPRRTTAAAHAVHVRRILPLDRRWLASLRAEPWPTRCLPVWPGSARQVLQRFLFEYLFVATARSLVDALASEHAARLASMQSAERSIDERIATLGHRLRQARQADITHELLDIVAGFEALRGTGHRDDDDDGGRDAP